ncbi:MAG: N-6 DNA methylase [Daejeonella sp.]
MLDTTTKKRIDDCRDILVGKLPDPKAQIEQITIGLIYKFMDDMDKEAIELGGAAKFFSGDYEKYSWNSLFDTKVTATEMLRLYSEAIESMEKNPNIPQLFRNIFNNAYLPYRDPETLKLFLKTIGEFEYTHSEMLGDAFEYLLSVMGSQGDAGQFRTPRHIIDFLVAVVNPGKNDTILDPACGTAGFLISAFKHIKEKNNNELTPDERKKLIQNFVGYDISPDMVRLSLVNLYLHGFSDPDIHEYDTLSSEERWNDSFDVILANPPFMSPKGGIRPHKKFSISSNRSEVLFVDYIAEHLNPKGRAGIIVPEGVIFQSGTAYKELRKMLVDNYLYAVVSLPAGIFNPYSGVKTSILLMDKELAKKSDEILFVKIDNDGFNLGAQRNAVKGGQLEEAIKIIHDFAADEKLQSILPSIAHIVQKTEIAKNGDYNLSGERYKSINIISKKYDSVKLGEVCRVINGKAYQQDELLDAGKYPVLRVGNFFSNRSWYYSDLELDPDKYCSNGDLLYAWSASFGPKIWDGGKSIYHYHIWKMAPDESKINKYFLYHVLNRETESIKAEGGRGIAMMHITKSGFEQREIPLPPLPIQEEIVAEIEGYQKIIDGAKMVVENYKPKIDIDPEWEMVELVDIIDNLETGVSVNSENKAMGNGEIGVLKTSAITYGIFRPEEHKMVIPTDIDRVKCNPRKDSIIISRMNTENLVGASVYIDKDFKNLYLPDRLWQTVISRKDVSVKFVQLIISSKEYRKRISDICGGTSGSMKNISKKEFLTISIPLPILKIQHQIADQIQKEQEIVNSNKQLIKIFEQKIKDRIAKVWGTEKEREENLSMAAEPEAEYQSSVK